METIRLDSDYMAGAHPKVMERLCATNLERTPGYGSDAYTRSARTKILEACGLTEGDVFFMNGGTQTNLVTLTRLLDYSDGVMATPSAHISVHEAGAIEAAGHKVINLPEHDGKLRACDIDNYVKAYYADDTYPHIVRPAGVYITFPTEVGTLYSLKELEEISAVCRKHDIFLYMDGARMAYGLAASPDVTLKDIARLCDVFYVGGTKCGALFGEAVVTRRPELLPRFFSLCKQRGAVPAKGRLLGVQFEALFIDNLYLQLGRHAIEMAMRLKRGLLALGLKEYLDSPTNQQFFYLTPEQEERLRGKVTYELWGPRQSDKTPVRFVTDWCVNAADIDRVIALLS